MQGEHLNDTVDVVRTEVNRKLNVLGIVATLYEQWIKDDRDVLEFFEKERKHYSRCQKACNSQEGYLQRHGGSRARCGK